MWFSRTCGLAVAFLAAMALSGCGSDDAPAAGSNTPSPVETASTAATPTGPSSTPSTQPSPSATPTTPASTADVAVNVTIAGGKISAGGHTVVKAKRGQMVQINGVSDVAESLHVHGYDKTLELKPGKQASLEFKADTKGIFEVETHESGKLVFKLQVS